MKEWKVGVLYVLLAYALALLAAGAWISWEATHLGS
jgi:hypothetical protein